MEAKQLIERNRATIERIADHFSAGGLFRITCASAPAQSEGPIIHVLGASSAGDSPSPYVRISPNERVVVADRSTGRQLQFLGQIRRLNGARRFVLATKANGFFVELGTETAARLLDLDGMCLDSGYGEERLSAEIGERLGLA